MDTINGVYEKALKEKADILKTIEPLRVQEDTIVKELHKVEADLKAIRVKIVEMEEPRLAEVSRLIARLAPNQKTLSTEAT